MNKKCRKRGVWGVVTGFALAMLFSHWLLAADNYPVCKVDWISEDTARLELKWKNPEKTPLMIAGWLVEEGGTLRISYQEKGNGDFAGRTITVDKKVFPCSITLVKSRETTEKTALFVDYPKEREKQKAISNLYHQGIISGYPDGTFGAQKNVTRAEFSKILCEALNLEPQKEETKNPFTDIDKSWAKPYILALYERELVNGKSENRFDPNGKVTLGEVMALLDRSFYLYSGKNFQEKLPDHWSNLYYLQMKGNKVVLSQDDIYQFYQPNRAATRMEVALFVSRVLTQKHDKKRG